MFKIFNLLFLLFILLIFPGFAPAADETTPPCTPQAEKPGDDRRIYSLEAQVDGPLFFDTIACGLQHRYKELCAMEMVSFDTSGLVYDYYTTEKVSLGKAFYWLDESDPTASVVAFASREAAEKFIREKGAGVIVDYDALTEKIP